jgi:organic hydroperoxide reductase OsmC/OhrA
MPTKPEKVLYTAKAYTTGGRDGRAVTDDGSLDVRGVLNRRTEACRDSKEIVNPGECVDRRQCFPRTHTQRFWHYGAT